MSDPGIRTGGAWLQATSVRLIPWVLLAAAPPADAQPGGPASEIQQVVRDASRALQSGNAALFLSAFDRKSLAGFAAFQDQVAALTAQRRIASSVEPGRPRGGPEEWTLEVDWLLDLTPRIDPGPVERRQASLVLGVRKAGRRWKIIRIDPRSFFASVRADP